EFAPKTLNIRRKSYFGPLSNLTIHVSTSRANPESSQIIDSRTRSVRPSDSVRLRRVCAVPTIQVHGGNRWARFALPTLRRYVAYPAGENVSARANAQASRKRTSLVPSISSPGRSDG